VRNLIYEYEIPDPAHPIPESERGMCGPSGQLVKFHPPPVSADEVVGRHIAKVSPNVGTYGMGGPGFFGLCLGDEWLVVAIWGAAEWMLFADRLVADSFYEKMAPHAGGLPTERMSSARK